MSTHFRHKLVIKRRYIKAHEQKEIVEEVFKAFDAGKLTLQKIAQETKVSYGTLQYWHSKWRKNKNYRPGGLIGQHRRIFSKQEEESIACMIKMQFIDYHVMIRRKHLRRLLFNCWQSLDPEKRSALIDDRFMSRQFIKDFCKRNRLSFRTMRKKKRSSIDPEEVEKYLNILCKVFKKYPRNLIFNMDETAWNFVYKRGKVLAYLNKEEVDAQLPDDYKNTFTVISTIAASGGKHKPFFIATGKTRRCEQQFDGMEADESEYILTHSESGKTTDEVMELYLKTLHTDFAKGKKCCLLLDQYASHISEETKENAKKYKVKLVFIPVSATDMYQPLDKYIFGILKSQACKIFSDKAFEFQQAFSKPEAADTFVKLWNDLKVRNVLKAWNCSESQGKDADEEEEEEEGEKEENAELVKYYYDISSDDDSYYEFESESEYSYDDKPKRRHHLRAKRH